MADMSQIEKFPATPVLCYSITSNEPPSGDSPPPHSDRRCSSCLAFQPSLRRCSSLSHAQLLFLATKAAGLHANLQRLSLACKNTDEPKALSGEIEIRLLDKIAHVLNALQPANFHYCSYFLTHSGFIADDKHEEEDDDKEEEDSLSEMMRKLQIGSSSAKVSMLEIYKEDIFDLLVPKRSYSTDVQMASPSKRYGIKHDQYGNIEVSGLTIVDVCIENEVSNLLRLAAMRRSTGKTKMNQQSSRSHFVFTLRVSGVNERTQQNVEGVLNLIDLASSARFSKSEVTEVQLKETQAINKSLFHLRKAISSLANKEGHVPFRDSKLTYILQPCLCGDSKALMFVNISSDPTSSGESLCSLRFAENVNTCELRGRRLYGNWHGV
ncbi:hypothetical protein CRG98_004903 [Punica granatum]|uniref:Kinesin motor domain-containing protein n=1 Tax=Punica granatum TaxID=22663 RepID=A0A2I0L355_PUNGR|nr:hypothetical protein CRG98_004903 [Punica granatum]